MALQPRRALEETAQRLQEQTVRATGREGALQGGLEEKAWPGRVAGTRCCGLVPVLRIGGMFASLGLSDPARMQS